MLQCCVDPTVYHPDLARLVLALQQPAFARGHAFISLISLHRPNFSTQVLLPSGYASIPGVLPLHGSLAEKMSSKFCWVVPRI